MLFARVLPSLRVARDPILAGVAFRKVSLVNCSRPQIALFARIAFAKKSSPKTFPSSVNIPAMTWSRLKKPCKCSHSKSMHSTKTVKGKPFTACNHPGCACKKFRLTKS